MNVHLGVCRTRPYLHFIAKDFSNFIFIFFGYSIASFPVGIRCKHFVA
jgi:hypothetical protein